MVVLRFTVAGKGRLQRVLFIMALFASESECYITLLARPRTCGADILTDTILRCTSHIARHPLANRQTDTLPLHGSKQKKDNIIKQVPQSRKQLEPATLYSENPCGKTQNRLGKLETD